MQPDRIILYQAMLYLTYGLTGQFQKWKPETRMTIAAQTTA